MRALILVSILFRLKTVYKEEGGCGHIYYSLYSASSGLLFIAMATVTDTVVQRRSTLEEETATNVDTGEQPTKEDSSPKKKKSRRPPRTSPKV